MTDEGITGLGETLHYQSKYMIDHVLAPIVVGQDPLNIARLRSRLLVGKDRPGAPNRAWETDPWAYSGFEMALYDILGKATGLPLSTLLGGLYRARVPFVAYHYPAEDRLSPEAIAEDCQSLVESSGAQTLELKIGVLSPSKDIETLQKIREGIDPSINIRIDVNGAWSVATAIQTLNRMESLDIANAEEPCLGLSATARVRRVTGIPISTHHADVWTIVNMAVADSIAFDLPSEGGLISAKETASAAAALGLGFWMRSTGELGIGTAAILQLAAAVPSMTSANQTVLHLLEDDILQCPFHLQGGYIELTEAPGLGVTLDEEKVQKYARLHATEGTYWFWGGRDRSAWEPPHIW